MTKRKMPFFFTLKAFQISLFFNSSIFHFIGTLNDISLKVSWSAMRTCGLKVLAVTVDIEFMGISTAR